MVKDAVITTDHFISIFIKNIALEKSDSIFEKQFDYINLSISHFTPSKYREKLSDEIFHFAIDLIGKVPAEENNRIVILKSKIPAFARNDDHRKILIKWKEGSFQPLKDHSMTIGQEWSTVVKAFTINDLAT